MTLAAGRPVSWESKDNAGRDDNAVGAIGQDIVTS